MFRNFSNETSELQAKAGLPGDKPGHYYRVREEDGELIEQMISPEGVEEKTVATGVKEGTPAVYLPRKTQVCLSFIISDFFDPAHQIIQQSVQRVILALGPDDGLQYYTYQNDADECDDEAKQISNVTNLHPQTAVAAGYTNKATHVFYQDTTKKLCCAETSDFNSNSWTLSGPLSAAVKPAGGTPLKTFATGLGELRLYYCSEDGYLHYLAFTEGPKIEGKFSTS